MMVDKFYWIDPTIIPDAAHLLHHLNIWCITNSDGYVLVYGNRPGSLQGNSNKQIAERFLERYEHLGEGIHVTFHEHVYLPDSPGNY